MSSTVDRNARLYERLGQYPEGFRTPWRTLPAVLEPFLVDANRQSIRRITQMAELCWTDWSVAFPGSEPPIDNARLASVSLSRMLEFRKGHVPKHLECVTSTLRYSLQPKLPNLDTKLPTVGITRATNILPLEHQLREANFLVQEYERVRGLNRQTAFCPGPRELGALAMVFDLR